MMMMTFLSILIVLQILVSESKIIQTRRRQSSVEYFQKKGINGTLRFKENGKFKIVQFSDIHFGDDDYKDQQTQTLMLDIIREESPDLVVVTGDIISGYIWDKKTKGWGAQQYSKFTDTMEEAGDVYWAVTGGNHDSDADLTRTEVAEIDRQFYYSLTQPGPVNISNVYNYMLPIYDPSGTQILNRLWFLDSGGENCLGLKGWGCVEPNQVEWFRRQNDLIPEEDPSKGRGFLFLHIPLVEYLHMYNDYKYRGTKGEDVSCSSINTGLFATLVEQRSVNWIVAGHDHNNDFQGQYKGINLAYGRKTGIGGYGPSLNKKGARVFEISINPVNSSQYDVDTWIREEGNTIDRQDRFGYRSYFSRAQRLCADMPQYRKRKIDFKMLPDTVFPL